MAGALTTQRLDFLQRYGRAPAKPALSRAHAVPFEVHGVGVRELSPINARTEVP